MSVDITWTRDGIQAAGFTEARSFAQIRRGTLPPGPGVYVVLSPYESIPQFLEVTTAGSHKKRQMGFAQDELVEAWVPSAPILYIGKATSLDERVNAYRKQGAMRSAGHYGGRRLWHLPDSPSLLVAWKEWAERAEVETALLRSFKAEFGKRPFANMEDGLKTIPADTLERLLRGV